MKLLAFLLSAILLLSSCKKDQTTSIHPSSFVFGWCHCYLCMTPEASFEYYEIKNGAVYPDSMNNFPGVVPLVFATIPLSNSKYQLAAALISSFPQYLQNNPNQTFGTINCNTSSAVHIEYTENGQLKTWDIDQDTANQPIAIRAYVAQMDSVFQQLIQ